MAHLLTSIGKMFNGLSFNTWYGKLAIAAGSLVTAFFSPILALLAAAFVFTTTDMIYGIKVAKMRKLKITSKKNWKGTLSKFIDEFTIISLARMLEFAVLGAELGVFVLTGGVTVIVCLTEMWSILENLNTLNPDGPWKALGKFLKKKGEDYIGTEIDLNNDDDKHTEAGAQSSQLDSSES